MYDLKIAASRFSHFKENEAGGSILLFNLEECQTCGSACVSRNALTTYGATPMRLILLGISRLNDDSFSEMSRAHDTISEGSPIILCTRCKEKISEVRK